MFFSNINLFSPARSSGFFYFQKPVSRPVNWSLHTPVVSKCGLAYQKDVRHVNRWPADRT